MHETFFHTISLGIFFLFLPIILLSQKLNCTTRDMLIKGIFLVVARYVCLKNEYKKMYLSLYAKKKQHQIRSLNKRTKYDSVNQMFKWCLLLRHKERGDPVIHSIRLVGFSIFFFNVLNIT